MYEHKKLRITYGRLTNSEEKKRVVHPVGILFSDFYFYLAAFIPEKETKNPTIYRIDRLKDYQVLDETFKIPYSGRFEEGEFRKRIQFMYGGDLQTITFRYFGESPEAIFDRFPTAELKEHNSDGYIFRAEVFGRGIKPWLLSQADKIELLKPLELRNEMIDLLNNMRNIYN